MTVGVVARHQFGNLDGVFILLLQGEEVQLGQHLSVTVTVTCGQAVLSGRQNEFNVAGFHTRVVLEVVGDILSVLETLQGIVDVIGISFRIVQGEHGHLVFRGRGLAFELDYLPVVVIPDENLVGGIV